jgi:thiol-disulfide isomerase/thioredoxin
MKIQFNRWKVATLVLSVVSVVLAVMLFQLEFAPANKQVNAAVEYVNKYLLESGYTAKLDKIETERTAPFQKITLDVNGSKYASYVSVDGKYLYAQEPINISKAPSSSSSSTSSGQEMTQKAATDVEGSFKEITEVDVCKENEKPIIYFFGSSTCPHCKWEEPILKSVINQFGDAVSYHENIDSETDIDVFNKYSSGSVPALIIGCKYYRIGSGEGSGEETEKADLTKVICRATGNLPASLCK